MVTFLIGNGFDKQVGLKTGYTDFYKVYTEVRNDDSKNIRRFKREILKSEAHNWSNWADFELQMGRHTSSFDGDTPIEDFIECFSDFVVHFNRYLMEECTRVNWSDNDIVNMSEQFRTSIIKFYQFILSAKNEGFPDLIGFKTVFNFLQFNYTDVFDKLLELSGFTRNRLLAKQKGTAELGQNLHVHGTMNGGYPTMGVNDESQIANPSFRSNPRHRS